MKLPRKKPDVRYCGAVTSEVATGSCTSTLDSAGMGHAYNSWDREAAAQRALSHADGSGSIDAHELTPLVSEMFPDSGLSAGEVDDWVTTVLLELDADGTGTLDFDEFVIMINRGTSLVSSLPPALFALN